MVARAQMALAVLAMLVGIAAALETELCGDAICGTYGLKPSFDDSNRPPSQQVLGRATWTVYHTFAVYLPDSMGDVEIKTFQDLMNSAGSLYPGKGGAMMTAILNNDVMKKEIQSIKNREDGMLVAWKLHNAITAAVKPNAVPFPEALGIKPSMFDLLNQPNSNHVQLENLNSAMKKQIIDALTTRWKATDGLINKHWSQRDLLNLPPDRTMLGRAFWTYLHTTSVYLPHNPSPQQIEAFKSLFDAVYHIFPCPVCRGHFSLFYPDSVLQKEHADIKSKHDAIMFAWKIHNIVTADGINRDEWPDRTMYPKDMHFNVSQFLIPSPHAEEDQMRLKICPSKTETCLDKDTRFEVIADVESRWKIEGGIDQPLKDDSPAACDPPKEGQKVLKMEMYIMGKCPWCAKAMEKIADSINCDYTCSYQGQELTARLDFNVHMVGLNNGTWEQPWLKAIHGPSELVGERLELCARQHYAKNYEYVKFFQCMDENVSVIPIRAPECAKKHNMDLDLLVSCANMEGETLVATSYGYASWMGIDITPTFVLNGKKHVLGLPSNFSDIVCEQLATTSTSLAETSLYSGGNLRMASGSERRDLVVTGVAVGFITMVVMGAALVVMRLRTTRDVEREALLP